MCFGSGAPEYKKPESYKDLPSLYFRRGHSTPVYRNVRKTLMSSTSIQTAPRVKEN